MKNLLLVLLFFICGYESCMAQWEPVGKVEPNIELTSPFVGYYYRNRGGGSASNPQGIGELLKSTDSWNNWSVIHTVGEMISWEAGYIGDLQFINDSVGCIYTSRMGFGGLLHTTDGGRSWNSVGSGPPLIMFSFVRADFGYYKGYGKEGFSFYLYDHGKYTEQDSIFAGKIPINSMLFINDSTGFLIKSWSSLPAYRTTDYGKTWNLSGDSSWIVKKVVFPYESKGFYLTYSSDLYSTSDLGASWTFVGKVPVWPVNDLFFLDSVTGWAGGTKGQILKTKTGGRSWETISAATDDEIYKIRFFSESVGYYIATSHYHSYETEYILYRTHAGPWEDPDSETHGPVRVLINPVVSSLLLTCDLPGYQISYTDIIDLRGQRLFHSEGFSKKIAVSSFSSGIYFLRYNSPQGIFSEKFIIIR